MKYVSEKKTNIIFVSPTKRIQNQRSLNCACPVAGSRGNCFAALHIKAIDGGEELRRIPNSRPNLPTSHSEPEGQNAPVEGHELENLTVLRNNLCMTSHELTNNRSTMTAHFSVFCLKRHTTAVSCRRRFSFPTVVNQSRHSHFNSKTPNLSLSLSPSLAKLRTKRRISEALPETAKNLCLSQGTL